MNNSSTRNPTEPALLETTGLVGHHGFEEEDQGVGIVLLSLREHSKTWKVHGESRPASHFQLTDDLSQLPVPTIACVVTSRFSVMESDLPRLVGTFAEIKTELGIVADHFIEARKVRMGDWLGAHYLAETQKAAQAIEAIRTWVDNQDWNALLMDGHEVWTADQFLAADYPLSLEEILDVPCLISEALKSGVRVFGGVPAVVAAMWRYHRYDWLREDELPGLQSTPATVG